jgi:hypothetical protein
MEGAEGGRVPISSLIRPLPQEESVSTAKAEVSSIHFRNNSEKIAKLIPEKGPFEVFRQWERQQKDVSP